MIEKTVHCEKCKKTLTVIGDNTGYPGWGHIAGLYNPDTGEEMAHVCPECKEMLRQWLNGGEL